MYGKQIRSEERHVDYLLMVIAVAVMTYLATFFGGGPVAQQEIAGADAAQAAPVSASQGVD